VVAVPFEELAHARVGDRTVPAKCIAAPIPPCPSRVARRDRLPGAVRRIHAMRSASAHAWRRSVSSDIEPGHHVEVDRPRLGLGIMALLAVSTGPVFRCGPPDWPQEEARYGWRTSTTLSMVHHEFREFIRGVDDTQHGNHRRDELPAPVDGTGSEVLRPRSPQPGNERCLRVAGQASRRQTDSTGIPAAGIPTGLRMLSAGFNHSVEAHRGPAPPLEAGPQLGSPFSARASFPARSLTWGVRATAMEVGEETAQARGDHILGKASRHESPGGSTAGAPQAPLITGFEGSGWPVTPRQSARYSGSDEYSPAGSRAAGRRYP